MKSALLLFALVMLPVAVQAQELPLGSPLPLADQTFSAADGSSATMTSLAGEKGLVVVFWANKCAWVDRYEARLLDLARAYGAKGYRFALVNSYGPGAAAESADASKARYAEKKWTLPYILDSDAAFAKALGAKRAPQVFVFDGNRSLAYVGAIDDKPSDAASVSSHFLRDALDAGAAGNAPATPRSEALGCLISY